MSDIFILITLNGLLFGCLLAIEARDIIFRQRVPFYESMTTFTVKLECFPDLPPFTVRVWRHRKHMAFMWDTDVIHLRNRHYVDESEVAKAIKEIPGVAAFEILDAHGNGGVVYLEWP